MGLFAGLAFDSKYPAAFLVLAAFEAVGGLPRAGALAGHAESNFALAPGAEREA